MTASAAAKPNAAQIAGRVDRLIADEVFTETTELAPRTSDATYLRRVWLDLVGEIPTPDEVTLFLDDPAPDKRQRTVRELLSDPRFGENWARYWRDVVMYRRIEDRAQIAAPAMEADLAEWFNVNKPWDEIATEFVTATGDVRENGATAIIAAQDGRTEEVTAETARIFLGIQIQCAQCHDHPYDRWQREQFHELAAFYPRVALRPVRTNTRRSFEVVGNDRPQRRRRPNANRRGSPEHYMTSLEQPDARGELMQPKFFLTGAEVPTGTRDAERRGKLAEWLTDNEWFATAYVNRIWAELVGEGFYDPVDDLGPDRTATAPRAVDLLSKSFAESGYDVKWLFRAITATEAYQRECRPRRASSDTPLVANVAQRLRGDQVYNSLLTVLELDAQVPGGRGRSADRPMVLRRRRRPRTAVANEFGYDPSDPREMAGGSISQSLALMNMPRFNRAIRARGEQTMLGRLLAETDDDDALTTELYLRTLCREPTDDELDTARDFVAGVLRREAAYEDLLWALMNSAEFLYRR